MDEDNVGLGAGVTGAEMSIATLTKWFLAQIGEEERGENDVKYNSEYYGRTVSGTEYPWCAAFVWVGFQKTGHGGIYLDGGKSAYCPYIAGWAKEHGRWVTGGFREGDVILLDWDGDGNPEHVGYALSASHNAVHTVEGNVGGKVVETHRAYSVILGAYRPDYGEETAQGKQEEKAKTELPLLKRGSSGSAVLSAQVLLIHKWGISCGPCGADAELGQDTEHAVIIFQRAHGLEQDGEIGPITWEKMIGG